MPLILRPTPVGGKRVHHITQADLDAMLVAGDALRCPGYDIFEEVHADERDQGYMTRDMRALPAPAVARRGRPPKTRTPDEAAP